MRKTAINFLTGFCVLILGLATAVQAQVCEPAPVGLASWWTADGNALDSRSRNNGTLTGTTFVAGQNGQGFRFVPNDLFTADGSGSLDITGDKITIEAWVKHENNVIHPMRDFAGYIGKDDFPTEEYVLLFEGGLIANTGPQLPANQWQVEYVLTNSSGTRVHNQETNVLVTVDGNYHHFVLTYDGAGSPTNNVKIFIDGVLQPTNIPVDRQISGNLQSSPAVPLTIKPTGTNNPVSIDEISIYNRTLSAPEIQSISNAGTAGKCKPTATTAPSGQVGWWAGDGNPNDTAGTNNGTLQNGAGFAIGKVGQAFSLDGINDHISVANNASLNVQTGDFAVEAWVNLQSVGGTNSYSFIAGKDGCGNANIYALGATPSSGAQLRLINSSGADFIAFAGSPLTTNVWHHLVGVRDGTTLKIFVNGVQAGSTAISGTFGSQTFPFTIGERPANGAPSCRAFVDGLIDEVSLYNRALTDSEISSIFNAGIGGKLKQATTPTGLADWDLGISDLGFEKTGHRPTLQSPQVVNTTIGDVTITFPTVTAAGTTQQIPLDTGLFPALPSGTHTGLVYDIATTALFTGDPTVCLNVPSFSAPLFANLRVMHFTGGAWQNVTAASNIFPTLCTEPISSFSPFAVAIIAPSAANVSVSGRVLAANGRPISQATVVFTNSNGTSVSAQSNPFGFYRIDGLAAGTTYTVTTANKRFQFETIVVTPFDDLSDFDITASSGGKLRDSR